MQQLEVPFPYYVDVLRLDLIDEEISGNKWFKLKKNVQEAQKQGKDMLLTFGGQHSNHLAALSSFCRRLNLTSIGIIRGERLEPQSNTLIKATNEGMVLKFVSRADYARKENAEFLEELKQEFGDFYMVPEGGSNTAGVTGCMEIISEEWNYDYVITAVGTGTTFAGLMASGIDKFSVIGVSVLKGENKLPQLVGNLLMSSFPERTMPLIGKRLSFEKQKKTYAIINDYAFSGFAGYDAVLHTFKKEFEERFRIPLDYLYTNKLFFGVFDLMQKLIFPEGSKILIIHSGGLQGNDAFEKRYQLTPIL